MQLTEKIASIDDEDKRFDNVARRAFPSLSLSRINKAIRKGDLRLNHQKVKGNEPIYSGDIISYKGFLQEGESASIPAIGDGSSLSIVFEGTDLLALNKKAGMLVHGGAESLEKEVRAYLGSSPSLSFRPGPCHRLDRNTSGLIVFSKTATGARLFSHALQNDQLDKIYLALLRGELAKESLWQHQLERANHITFVDGRGKDAQTLVTPLAYGGGCTLVKCLLKSGRTHQIRAQAAAMSLPLAGDIKYGGGGGGYFLHAYQLLSHHNNLFSPLMAALPSCFVKRLKELSIKMD